MIKTKVLEKYALYTFMALWFIVAAVLPVINLVTFTYNSFMAF